MDCISRNSTSRTVKAFVLSEIICFEINEMLLVLTSCDICSFFIKPSMFVSKNLLYCVRVCYFSFILPVCCVIKNSVL